MSDYRRLYVPGGLYFFTVVAYRRQPIFADIQRVALLRQAFQEVKCKRPFDITAAVILPDHLHCLWLLPEGDFDYSTRWQMIKTAFSRRVSASVKKTVQKPFGNHVFSSIVSVTNPTLISIWITSITTPSNMVWPCLPVNGHTVRFNVL